MHRTEKKKRKVKKKVKVKKKKSRLTGSSPHKNANLHRPHVCCTCAWLQCGHAERHEGGIEIATGVALWWHDSVVGVEGGVCQGLQWYGHFQFWV